jgi:hypothetical protein
MTTTPGEGGTFSSGESSSAAGENEEDRCTQSGGARGLDSTRGVGVQSEADTMLLDRYLPRYDVTETHAVVVDADTDLTWQAVRRSDLSRSAVIQALLELRSLPNRLQRVLKRQPPGPARPPLTLDDMQRAGFLLLGESPGHEIVFGSVAQPWKAVTGDEPARQVEPGRFAAFARRIRQIQVPGTIALPLTPALRTKLGLAWRKDSPHDLTRSFVELART